jgi:hypothetical protein
LKWFVRVEEIEAREGGEREEIPLLNVLVSNYF